MIKYTVTKKIKVPHACQLMSSWCFVFSVVHCHSYDNNHNKEHNHDDKDGDACQMASPLSVPKILSLVISTLCLPSLRKGKQTLIPEGLHDGHEAATCKIKQILHNSMSTYCAKILTNWISRVPQWIQLTPINFAIIVYIKAIPQTTLSWLYTKAHTLPPTHTLSTLHTHRQVDTTPSTTHNTVMNNDNQSWIMIILLDCKV